MGTLNVCRCLREKTSIFRNRFVLSIFYVFSIFLFLAIFSPTNSYAYTTFYEAPNTSYLTSFYTEVFGGCAYTDYSLDDGFVRLGSKGYPQNDITTSASDLYNCGYRWVNNHFNYFQHVAGLKRTLSYGSDGTVTTDTYASTGGNTNSIFSYNSDYASLNFDIFNQIESIQLTYAPSTTGSFVFDLPYATDAMCIDENNVLQTSGCYELAVYLLLFDMPDTAGLVGTYASLSSSSLQYTNWPMSSTATYDDIKNATIFSCGYEFVTQNDLLSSIFPNSFDNIPSGYSRCYLAGTLPLSSDGYIRLGDSSKKITFKSLDASDYSRSGWITNSGLNLAYYGYPWSGLFVSPSYKTMGARSDLSFKFINPSFKLVIPDQYEDVVAINTLFTAFTSEQDSSTSGTAIETGDTDGTPSNSVIMGWFNVFDGLSVLFPFGSFFSAFIAPDTCASIPTLASWLNLPSDTTYCSWWPNSVVSAITPVFTGLSMMLLFGFIVSWLRGDRAYSIFHERSS